MEIRRKRVLTTKPSRRGCRTCRARKIKCDEARPACHKCTSTGRKCEGFELSPEPLHPSKRPLFPSSGNTSSHPLLPPSSQSISPTSSLTALQPRTTTPDLSITPAERTAFTYFQTQGAASLYKVSPTKGWIHYALQFATSEPAVFHAVTAFAVVQKSVEFTLHRLLEPPSARTELELAEEQFGKASASLRSYIDRATNHNAGIEPILLCCILFVSFELLRGNSVHALTHLDFGQRIIQGTLPKHAPGSGAIKAGLPVSRDLGEIFAYAFRTLEGRDVSAARRIFPKQQIRIAPELLPRVGRGMSETVLEAKAYLLSLFEESKGLRAEGIRLGETCIAAEDRRTMNPAVAFVVAQALARTRLADPRTTYPARIRKLVQAHEDADAMLLRLQEGGISGSTFPQIALLRLQLFVSAMHLRHCTETRECAWDAYTEIFATTLNLTERLLEAIADDLQEERHEKAKPLPQPQVEMQTSFSLEPAVLPALGLMAMKSRDSRIRQRAIRMLESADRREGLLYSQSLAWFHGMFVGVEEDMARAFHNAKREGSSAEAGELLRPADVPEEVRFLDSALSGESRTSSRLVFGRFAHEKGGELEIFEYVGEAAVRRWPGSKEPPVSLGEYKLVERRMTGYWC